MLAHNALSYVFSQSGFFKRAAFRTMPKYQGVKICKKEQYQVNQGFLIVDTTKNKKHWITSWTEKTQYYWWKHYNCLFLDSGMDFTWTLPDLIGTSSGYQI